MATPRQIACCTLFQAEGYAPSGAASWVGNFSQEVGPNLPCAKRPAKGLDHGSQYLGQWRLGRLTEYEAFVRARHPEATDEASRTAWYGNMGEQVKFATMEMKRDYPALDKALRAGGSVETLTTRIMTEYERPNHDPNVNKLDRRIKWAEDTYTATPRLHPESPSTAPNHAVIEAKKTVQTSNANAGLSGVLLAMIGGLHWFAGMPLNLALWAAAAAVIALIYSVFDAQKASSTAITASAKASIAIAPPVELEPTASLDGPAPEGGQWVFDPALRGHVWTRLDPPEPIEVPPEPKVLTEADIPSLAEAIASIISQKLDRDISAFEGVKV